MQARMQRETVDLSGHPDLMVIDLGFYVRRIRALPALMRLGRGFGEMARHPPAGLLEDRRMLLAWNHLGIRQYWADHESLMRFTRSEPHATWWRTFLERDQGAGFWHEAYGPDGAIEAVYVNMPKPVGLGRFAPSRAPVGPFLSASGRLQADREDRGQRRA